MPDTDTIVYALISGLIALLIAIIGALLMIGFNSIKEELKGIRSDLKDNAKDNTQMRAEIAAIRANCAAQRDNGIHASQEE